MIKKIFRYIKELFIWFRDKELIEEQIKIDTHKIDLQNAEIGKLRHKLEELKPVREQNDKYLETIKEQRKEIRKLKKQIKELS